MVMVHSFICIDYVDCGWALGSIHMAIVCWRWAEANVSEFSTWIRSKILRKSFESFSQLKLFPAACCERNKFKYLALVRQRIYFIVA